MINSMTVEERRNPIVGKFAVVDGGSPVALAIGGGCWQVGE